MQKISPLIKQIGQLIDVRIKTLKINIVAEIKASEEKVTKELRSEIKASEEKVTKDLRAEIKASEERTTKQLRSEIKESEERTTNNLRVEIKEAEGRLTKKLQAVEDKLDRKINDHEVRIEKLEKYSVLPSTP